MSNTVLIKHGTSTPTTDNLQKYELGYKHSGDLYINDNGTIVQLTQKNFGPFWVHVDGKYSGDASQPGGSHTFEEIDSARSQFAIKAFYWGREYALVSSSYNSIVFHATTFTSLTNIPTLTVTRDNKWTFGSVNLLETQEFEDFLAHSIDQNAEFKQALINLIREEVDR